MSTDHKMPPSFGEWFDGYRHQWKSERDVALDAWNAAIEAAATVCLNYGIRAYTAMQDDAARECASAIRQLKEPT